MSELEFTAAEGPCSPCESCGSTENACDHRMVLTIESYENLLHWLEAPEEANPAMTDLMRAAQARRDHMEKYW